MTEFRVWAPKAKSVSLVIVNKEGNTSFLMQRVENGYFQITLQNLSSPVEYLFCLDGKKTRPDPASKWQPRGVHGPSRLLENQEFMWEDAGWKGIPLIEYIIYEVHVGTFTQEGTFEAIIEKLPYLASLGITAIELMPVGEFPGTRNWGYDGTYIYSPHHAYGGPYQLKKLINACHQSGIAVILDVVYNHLGPEGNYLGDFGFYFTDRYKTPWGQAINFDGPYSDEVRAFFINNALFWLTVYHVDALRLDAVHAIFDNSAVHFLQELGEAFHKQADLLGKQAYIIAESDLNDVRIINSKEKGGEGLDAQWSDDFHHSVHAFLTHNRSSYFADFGALCDLVKAISNGFVYDWKYSIYRKKRFGSSSVQCPGQQFVITIQNHDQIGNACRGKRLGSLIDEDLFRIATVVLMLSPNIPLLFMGQEFNAATPFLFFTSYEDQNLAQSVREGYKNEMQMEDGDIDPQDPERFLCSKLNWQELDNPKQKRLFSFYQELICLRKKFASLSKCQKDRVAVTFSEEEKWLVIERSAASDRALIAINFSRKEQVVPALSLSGQWELAFVSSKRADRVSERISSLQKNILVPGRTALVYTQLFC